MPITEVRKPKCKIELTGPQSNVYAIIGEVRKALRADGQRQRADEFRDKAYGCEDGYEGVLKLCEEYVTVVK